MKKLLENFSDAEIMAIQGATYFHRDMAEKYAYHGSGFTDPHGNIYTAPPFKLDRKMYVEVHQKIKIGEAEVNAPYRVKPELGAEYWYFDGSFSNVSAYLWVDDRCDNRYLSGGNCFKSQDDAVAALNAIKSLLKGK